MNVENAMEGLVPGVPVLPDESVMKGERMSTVLSALEMANISLKLKKLS